jgi:hypothetical protein
MNTRQTPEEEYEYWATDPQIHIAQRDERIEYLERVYDEACQLRGMYHAAWLNTKPEGVTSCKSRLHHDGEVPFGDSDWFIVQSLIHTGWSNVRLISNHYEFNTYWHLFDVPESHRALWEHDNHETKDVISRMDSYNIIQVMRKNLPNHLTKLSAQAGEPDS